MATYFVNAAAAKQSPYPGYSQGRGFPDISFAGSSYSVFIGGIAYSVSGTSASSPVAAGILSNVNAARMAVGKGSVGWVNPALYMNSTLFLNDITSGSNKCAATGGGKFALNCCAEGYSCTTGWDPVTGLGSINYGKMVLSFSALGSINSATGIPSVAPTQRASTPSYNPTIKSSSSSSCHIYGKCSFGRDMVKRRGCVFKLYAPSCDYRPASSPVCLRVCSPVVVSTCLPAYLPTYLPTYFLTICLPTSPPTHLAFYLPTCLPACLPTYLPTFQPTHLPTSLPTNRPAYLPANLPPYLPTDLPGYPPTYLPFFTSPSTYLVNTINVCALSNDEMDLLIHTGFQNIN